MSSVIGAIDIGGTKIAIGLVSEKGELLASEQWLTQPELGFSVALERIIAALRKLKTQTQAEIYGIGIGCTGPVNPFKGTLENVPFLPGWEGGGLVQAISEAFHLPVVLENDADAACLGEFTWGAGQGKESFVYITVGTGIGGGMVLHGRLYRGVGDAHPEVGHIILESDGPLCSCGARGCWESLASGPALAAWYSAQEFRHRGTVSGWDAKQVCAAAESGDPLARKAIQREASYLGLGLANLITLYVPQVIALGGGLINSYHLFREGIRQTICNHCKLVPHERVTIAPAKLGRGAGLIGAAGAFLQRRDTV